MAKPVRAVRALQSFSIPGTPDNVFAGELYRSDDPRVRGREHLFVDVYESLGIEQATATPGKKRSAKKPEVEDSAGE